MIAGRVAGLVCRAAAAFLPPSVRERYVAEWRADLADEPGRALAYSFSLVSHIAALRMALEKSDPEHPPVPVRCRLRHHRSVTIHDNPENMRFISHHCTQCGYVRDEWRGRNLVTWGWSSGQIH